MAKEVHTAVSSLAFTGKSPEEIISIAERENYVLEFSSGLPYRKNMEEIFLNAAIKKIPHNYFPAPEKPFVLNLASTNDVIRNLSIAHCINGLRLASLARSPFFSAHAGFCIDPDPAELGKKLYRADAMDKKINQELFIDSLKKILFEAKKYKVGFLIENNVIAPMNLYNDGRNPLFCCDDTELLMVIAEIKNSQFGILLDTAHLKVSSNTLAFSLNHALKNIKPYVKAIHHSDNDGILDTNDELTANYWFWHHIRDFADIYHVLEVKNQTIEQVNFQLSLIRNKILN